VRGGVRASDGRVRVAGSGVAADLLLVT